MPANVDEQFQQDVNKAGNKVKNAAKKAANKAKQAAKKAAKKIAKQVAKATAKATWEGLKTAFWASPVGWIVAIILILIFLVIFIIFCVSKTVSDEEKVANPTTFTNDYAYSETIELLSSAFYQKYSDQSYYFYLQEPDEKAATEELDYSGKTYEELGGIATQGLTQSSNSNYIKDIDGYEDVVKLNYATLAVLDRELNGASTNDGVYNPEQLTKMLYTGEKCSIDDENFDPDEWGCVKEVSIVSCSVDENGKMTEESTKNGCVLANKPEDSNTWEEENKTLSDSLTLGDITEAQSVKYEEQEDGTYNSTEETETSVSDYGLGSIVHYKAYFQPSRVSNYEIKTVQYVKDDWNFDSGETPLISTTWASLSDEEQEDVMTRFAYNAENMTAFTKDGEQTGLYEVEDEIVYKNWSSLYEKTGSQYWFSDSDEWGTSEPGISTGIYDTEIVYAIDNAITFAGTLNTKVTQKWTDLGDASHTQTGTFFKDYTTSKHGKNHEEYAVSNFGSDSITSYRKLYANRKFIGYISGGTSLKNITWVEGKIEKDEKGTTPTYTPVKAGSEENDNYCKEHGYVSGSSCYRTSHSIKTEKPNYEISYRHGYWEATLVLTTNLEETSETIKIGVDDGEVEYYNGESEAEYNKIKNLAKSENKEDSKYNWYYTPSYKIIVSAEAEGIFQINLVSHTTSASTTVSGSDYLEDYIKNYEAYVPETTTIWGCGDSNPEDFSLENEISVGTISSSFGTCKDTNYLYSFSSNKTTSMNTLALDLMSEVQVDVLNQILQYNEAENKLEFSMDEEGLETNETFSDEYKKKLSEIGKTYSDVLKKSEQTYGVDKNIIVLFIYVAEENDSSNALGLKCDKTCTLKDVDIFDSALKQQKIDITINESASVEELIMYASAKMQTLLKKYEGNLPLAILDYEIGEDGVNGVLSIYEAQTGTSKEQAITDMYETGWYHYLKTLSEINGVFEALNLNVELKGDGTFIKAFFENMKISSIFWRERTLTSTNVHIWKRYSMSDKLSVSGLNKDNPDKTKMFYFLMKNDYENYKKYWSLLTSGQKTWNDGIYLPQNLSEDEKTETYRDKIHSYKTGLRKIALDSYADSVVSNILRTALLIAGDISYDEADTLSDNYLLQRIGSSKIVTIEPSYKSFFSGGLVSPAKEYSTLSNTTYGNQYIWTIKVEEGDDVFSITDGTIQETGKDYVSVYLKKNNGMILYNGLTDIEVEPGDSAQKKTLGKSSGQIEISLFINGEYYDMKAFMDQYQSAQNSSSSAFMGLFTGSFGSFADKILSPEERDAVWAEAINTPTKGWAGDRQCTEFSNYMMDTYWGPSGQAIGGNGYQKVENAKTVYGDALTNIYNDLSEFGDSYENILFSWADGGCGHTGWINSFTIDPSAEGGGTVVVSQGNIYANGEYGQIMWEYEYTYEEWVSVVQQNIQYVAKA